MGKIKKYHFESSAGRIAYRLSEGRRGQTVLIHGNSSSWESFEPQMASSLGQRYSMAALDLPGHGDSAWPADPVLAYNLVSYPGILEEFCSQLGWNEPVLVGHSLGGHIALQAGARGLRAKAIMVFGTPPLGSPPALDEAFNFGSSSELLYKGKLDENEARSLARAFLGGVAEPAPCFVKSILATDPAARPCFGASIGVAQALDERVFLSSFDGQVALVLGEGDSLVNRNYVASVSAKRLWRGALQIVPGGSHSTQYDAPEAFNALLGAFLAEVFDDS